MGKLEFVNQLKALGFEPQELDTDKVYFEYEVPVGKNMGKKILMGFEQTASFPMSAPPGPHIKPISDGWIQHPSNIHDNIAFGVGWKYWSRPFNEWNQSDKTVKIYLAHIKRVMMTI
jgi:hypothetical protein